MPEHVARVGPCASSNSAFEHRATGTPATMRSAGRPAPVAAEMIRGATWSPIARSSAIQRMVPLVCSPAIRNMVGPSAAISIGIGIGSATSIGLCTR